MLIEHENLQYSIPVSLHAWQSDPLGHTKPVQAAMKIQNIINVTASERYHQLPTECLTVNVEL